jgi:uncharacterized protein (TIGR02147 family)
LSQSHNQAMMLNIDEISDYRDLLKQYYVQRKLDMPLYSYRMMGMKLGLETSQIFRILNKEYHLPTRCIPLAKDLLGLSGRSGELFEILVAAVRTRSKTKQDKLYEMALALRDVELRKLNTHELLFLSKWWIPVVRSYIELYGGDADPGRIAKCIIPPISREQVVEALQVLENLGFVTKRSSGQLGVSKYHFTSSGTEKTAAIRSYQNQVFALGQNALATIPPSERSISTLMVSVDEDCFQELQEMSREFRRQIQKRVEDVAFPDRAMQVMVSIFPVMQKKGRK